MKKEHEAMRPLILAMLLIFALTSAALADTTRCTTRHDAAFQRWASTCTDGSRAITRYDVPFNCYRTDVITSPEGAKPPCGWPVPGKAPR